MQGAKGFQKTIDDFIDGLIGFAYNAFATVVLVWWRPLLNAARLHILANTEDSGQIRSSTFLFITTPLLVWVPRLRFDPLGVLHDLISPFGRDWVTDLCAFVSAYVVADVLARIFSYLYSPPRRRARNLDIIRYCAGASFLLFAITTESIDRFSNYLDPHYERYGSYWGVLWGAANIATGVFSFYPLICAVKLILYPSWKRPSRFLLSLRALNAVPFAMVFLFSASFAGDFAQRAVGKILSNKRPIQAIDVHPIACLVRWDGKFMGVIRLMLDGDQRVVIPADVFRVTIRKTAKPQHSYSFDASIVKPDVENQSLFTELSGGVTNIIYLSASIDAGSIGWPIEEINACHIEPLVVRAGLDAEWSYTSQDASARYVRPVGQDPPSHDALGGP